MDQIEEPWSPEEDEMLDDLVVKCRRDWIGISNSIPGRSGHSCRSRWLSLLQIEVDVTKILWSREEDEMLESLVKKHGPINLFSEKKHGPINWPLISKSIPGQSVETCMSRWLSLQWSFTPEEDEMLQNLFEKHGPNWSLICKSIPGKSARMCDLRWYAVWNPLWNSTSMWKRTSKTNEDITIGARIPPPSFSNIGRRQVSSYIHAGNINHEVGGVSGQAPSVDDMARNNVSQPLGSTHYYSRGQGSSYIHEGNLSHEVGGVSGQAPSVGDMARYNVSQPWVGTHSYSHGQGSSDIHDRNLSHEVGGVNGQAPSIGDTVRNNVSQLLGRTHSYSRDESAPTWSALNKRDSSPTMIESDNEGLPMSFYESLGITIETEDEFSESDY